MEIMRPLRRLGSNNLLILLLALIFLLLAVPLMEGLSAARVLFRLGMTFVIVIAAVATRRAKLLLFLGLLAATITASVNWLPMATDNHLVFLSGCVLEAIFLAMMAVVILTSVVKKHLATIHSIYGAICAYLLLGLAWAMLYLGLCLSPAGEWTITGIDVDAQAADGEVEAFSQLIYFSFVTMSTLGYGDMTPETVLVRTLTWMQSVSGQFYIAVLVAWLVSEIPRRRFHDALERRVSELERAPSEPPQVLADQQPAKAEAPDSPS